MGTLITFESKRFLLQHEDFPAALKAFKKIAKEVPGFFPDAKSVLAAKDLRTALEVGDFFGEFDRHGDMVKIKYGVDKVPTGAPDDFPEQLIFAWKKIVPDAIFHLWLEGNASTRALSLRRGKVFADGVPAPRWARFEQIGPPPRCVPGESAEVHIRLVARDPNDTSTADLTVSVSASAIAVEQAPKTMQAGDEATIRFTLKGDAHHWTVGEDTFVLYATSGKRQTAGWIAFETGGPIFDVDTEQDVLASESSLNDASYLRAKDVPAAHERVRRYCVRHKNEPGAAFLAKVEAAPDLATALREASLEPSFNASGSLCGLAFQGKRLPGAERHLYGMLESYAKLTEPKSLASRLRFAYRATPEVWATFVFDKGGMRWWREPRGAE